MNVLYVKKNLHNDLCNPIKKCIQCRPIYTNFAYFYIESNSFSDLNIIQVYSKNLDKIFTFSKNIFTFIDDNKSEVSIKCETSNLIDIDLPNFINEDKIKTMLLFI